MTIDDVSTEKEGMFYTLPYCNDSREGRDSDKLEFEKDSYTFFHSLIGTSRFRTVNLG